MEKVTGYLAEDGKLYKTEQDVIEADRERQRQEWEKVIKHFNKQKVPIVQYLIANRREFIEFLNSYDEGLVK